MTLNPNDIAGFIANKAAGISGVRGASPNSIDTIPGTPWAYVGAVHQGSIIPGSWERTRMDYPLRLLIARTADAARNDQTVNSFVASFIAAFRSQGTESATVASTVITYFSTDYSETVGGEDYDGIEFTVEVVVNSAVGYTA